ncbi:PiggyBac transposable element-derived protein 4 [Folsomia candida]|uniref:PiggyBac transposable element-derived protein 4 n=2 Tax=Folsomia candida TaxID=158441 RepID=A0A226EUP8_FOLCA|nr:PiggyBac transposable element-derived protein 4 [Folsomia candida]
MSDESDSEEHFHDSGSEEEDSDSATQRDSEDDSDSLDGTANRDPTFRENELFAPVVEDFDESEDKIRPEFGVSRRTSPLQMLQKFLTDGIIGDMIWQFLAITFMMGLVKKPSIREYWSTDELIQTPFFATVMSRNRFQGILRALHFSNNENYTGRDRFCKLGSFMHDILGNFSSAILPGKNICIDETLLAYKGRLSFRQYNPKKRGRFGIKMFVLCDCALKFVLNILPYQGKSTPLADRTWVKDLGFGGATVLTLLQGYLNKAHRVVLDNWFLGPKLAKIMLAEKTYVLGTVQRRRKGMPKMRGKLAKGRVETYCDDEILIERWSDRREVCMLNTFVPHSMRIAESSNPRNTREKPATVLLYNSIMGAVDNVDKSIKPYQSVRKSYKWYKKVVFNMIDVATYNSMILYNHLHADQRAVPYKDFVMKIVREIQEKYPTLKKPIRRPPTVPRTENPAFPVRLKPCHHIAVKHLDKNGTPSYSDCIYCKHHAEYSPKRKTTPFSCEICKVRLCIQGGDSCFKRYHTDKKLKKISTTPQNTQSQPHTQISQPRLPEDIDTLGPNAVQFIVSPNHEIVVFGEDGNLLTGAQFSDESSLPPI